MSDFGEPYQTTPASSRRQLPWDEGVSTPLPADAGFSPAEHWAWAQIISGRVADMRWSTGDDDGVGNDPNETLEGEGKAEGESEGGEAPLAPWPRSRILSARFLETILFHEPWASAKAKPWVRIQCAWLPDDLDWENGHVRGEIGLWQCRFDRRVNFMGLRIDRLLNLQGSRIAEEFRADRIDIEGGMFCRNGFTVVGETHILGGRIGGDANFVGAHLVKGLSADGIQVKGNLFCSGGFKAGGDVRLLGARVGNIVSFNDAALAEGLSADGVQIEGDLFCSDDFKAGGRVRLLGARIEGDVSFNGATLEQTLSADRVQIGGGLFCSNGMTAKGEIRLLGARVGGVVSFIGATLKQRLSADGLQVDGSLFCREGFVAESEVILLGSRIGGDAQLRGAFKDRLNLTGAMITGELQFDQGGQFPPEWGEEARLVLRNVTCGALAGAIASFQRAESNGKRPRQVQVPVDLLGFSYSRIGGMQGYAGVKSGATLADAPWRKLIEFLQSDSKKNEAFTPQPYRQLANALMAAGQEEKANRIRFELLEHERAAAGVPFTRKVTLWLSRHLIGHGFENWRAVIGFALVVLATAAAGLWYEGHLAPGFSLASADWRAIGDWGGYALGNSIPLLELDPAHRTFLVDRFGEQPPIGLKTLVYSFKLLGFVLLSYLAAGLSGLASRSAKG